MILKAKERGGGAQLARYLNRPGFTGEFVVQ
jgi:hypothetical protein